MADRNVSKCFVLKKLVGQLCAVVRSVQCGGRALAYNIIVCTVLDHYIAWAARYYGSMAVGLLV